MARKMGRPTDNPKSSPIHVRLDSECEKILDKYCNDNNVSRAEGVRRGIRLLRDKKKK